MRRAHPGEGRLSARWRAASPWLLAALLVGAGTAHFARPAFYDPLIPEVLPGSARAWTYGSGVVEVLLGALVAWPRTRRPAALASAGLFVAVFPGNVKALLDAEGTTEMVVNLVRLPLQVPLVLWALQVWRGGGSSPEDLGQAGRTRSSRTRA